MGQFLANCKSLSWKIASRHSGKQLDSFWCPQRSNLSTLTLQCLCRTIWVRKLEKFCLQNCRNWDGEVAILLNWRTEVYFSRVPVWPCGDRSKKGTNPWWVWKTQYRKWKRKKKCQVTDSSRWELEKWRNRLENRAQVLQGEKQNHKERDQLSGQCYMRFCWVTLTAIRVHRWNRQWVAGKQENLMVLLEGATGALETSSTSQCQNDKIIKV